MDQLWRNQINDMGKRIKALEEKLHRFEPDTVKEQLRLHQVLTSVVVNQMLIREQFLMEIIRDAGLLDKIAMPEIENRVEADKHVQNPGWGCSGTQARKNFEQIRQEMRGEPVPDDG